MRDVYHGDISLDVNENFDTTLSYWFKTRLTQIKIKSETSNERNMPRKTYVLEVVRFITNKDGPDGWLAKRGKYEHVGYMMAKFRTQNDACSYYDRHNSHMRALNAHGTLKSDWDPNTHLFYIVRCDYGMIDSIPPFDASDMPIQNENGQEYNFLK